MIDIDPDDEEILDELKRRAFEYFRHQWNPDNGLIADKNEPDSPASIAVLGMGLTVYAIAAESGLMARSEAVDRTLAAFRFLKGSRQGPETDASGYKGFYYHFLHMQTGKRTWHSELSTIDTAILMAGVLTAQNYFNLENAAEKEIREIADFLYRRVEWPWALNGAATFSHGWTPEKKFRRHRWNRNYSEAIILYALALGSPTHPVNASGYHQWTSTFETLKIFAMECLHAGPMFIHQMAHLWIDFRGVHDRFNKKAGFDYFENSTRATYIQRQYAIENPKNFDHYNKYCWGLTASDGPGPSRRLVKGVKRVFHNYIARGVPNGPDDGTISPWAVVASLPFAPDIVLDTISHMIKTLGENGLCQYGFDASYNPAFPAAQATSKKSKYQGWVSPWTFGLNQGPTIIMIENYQSELIWTLMKKCVYLQEGLKAAGFESV